MVLYDFEASLVYKITMRPTSISKKTETEKLGKERRKKGRKDERKEGFNRILPVYYTHMTLPTIRLG